MLDYFQKAHQSQDLTDFLKGYGKGLIPFAAVGAVLLLASLISCCCFCKSCSCCKGCQRDTTKRKRFCALLGLIFTIVLVGCAGAGLYFSINYNSGF